MTNNSNIKTKYSCIILAGGKGSRIDADKAQLQWSGKPFLQHILEKADLLDLNHIIISGYDFQWNNSVSVMDEIKDRGPLGGIHACLKESETPYCLVLPIDMPNIPLSVLEGLIQYHQMLTENWPENINTPVVIWEHGDRKEPLVGIYPAAMVNTLEKLIEFKSAPVFRLLDRWGYTCHKIEIDENEVINVNTRETYKKLIEIC